MKKKLYSIFMVIFIAYIVYTSGYAGGDSYAGEPLKFESDGSLTMTTYDQKATTDIRYRTIGWTIYSEDRTKSVVIQFEESESEYIDEDGDGYKEKVRTYFKIDKDIIFNRIGAVDKEWQEELYREGGDLIFDGVLTIVEYDGEVEKRRLGRLTNGGDNYEEEVYFTLDGIKNARIWGSSVSFDSHFNKKVHLDRHPEMLDGNVEVKHFLMDGSAISRYDYSEQVESGEHQYTARQIAGHECMGVKVKYGESAEGSMQISDSVILSLDDLFSTACIYFYYQGSENTGKSGEDIDPEATGVIKADDMGSEKFDVEDGIPCTEDLYVSVNGKDYLYSYNFLQIIDYKEYPINVTKTFNLSWEEQRVGSYEDEDGNTHYYTYWITMYDTEEREETVDVVRDYSYWYIDRLEVYYAGQAEVWNYALPNEGIVIGQPSSGYDAPELDVEYLGHDSLHIKEPDIEYNMDMGSESLSGGRSGRPSVPENFGARGFAESNVGNILARNDSVKFNGRTVMSGDWREISTEEPGDINSGRLVEKLFYVDGQTIDRNKRNGREESYGEVTYRLMDGSVNALAYDIEDSIDGINPVTIHTPVVCYAEVKDDAAYNQMLSPDTARASLILGRPSHVSIPTAGQHRNIKGYGNRDYIKYTDEKQIKFPFDTYINTTWRQEGKYVKANTWHTVSLEQDEVDFYLPEWVDEGDYTIEFREIAINDTGYGYMQRDANTSTEAYVAYDSRDVKVIGRLYGLRISDITDYPLWEEVFRQSENTVKHSGNYYRSGKNDENGKARDLGGTTQKVFDKLVLPIMNGSHIQYRNAGALKRGYKFRFELETLGNYFNDADCISITPSFYYVPYDGSRREKVDLWYNERFNGEENSMVKVQGAGQNRNNPKYMNLGNVYRSVPEIEIESTSIISRISERSLKEHNTLIGWLDRVILGRWVRTYTGDVSELPQGVEQERAKVSKQKWYGEYYLPAELFAAPEGYDVEKQAREGYGLTGKEDFWKKEGYIIVGFNIRTVKDESSEGGALGYKGPICNMWEIEAFNLNKKDYEGRSFPLQYGDIVFYYTDRSVKDDYSEGGTH